jgi:hypothetical protein
MVKSILDHFLALASEDATENDPDSSELPTASTLDDRANLYLNAVYGMREFNGDEYASARAMLLDAMAADVGTDPKSDAADASILANPTTPGSGSDVHRRSNMVLSKDNFQSFETDLDTLFEIPDPTGAAYPSRQPFIDSRAQPFSRNPDRAALATLASASSIDLDGPTHLRRASSTGAPHQLGHKLRRWPFILMTGVASLVLVTITAAILPLVLPNPRNEPSKPGLVAQFSRSERELAPRNNSVGQTFFQDAAVRHSKNPDLAIRLSDLGNRLIMDGDLYGGRLVLADAASEGSAAAALSLGATFDPGEVRAPGKGSIDPEKATTWYVRAKQLGSLEAQARLDRLSNGQH